MEWNWKWYEVRQYEVCDKYYIYLCNCPVTIFVMYTCEDLCEGYAALVFQNLAATVAINQAEKPGSSQFGLAFI